MTPQPDLAPAALPRASFSPDRAESLSARLHALGVEGNAIDLTTKGYTVVERVFDDAQMAELKAAIEACDDRLRTGFAARLLEHGRIFEQMALEPKLLALMEYLLGEGFLLYQLMGVVKGRDPYNASPGLERFGRNEALTIHSDYTVIPEPFPPYPQVVTAVINTEDFTKTSGCSRVVPGSHHMRRHTIPGEGDDLAVPVEMPRGSIVIWDGATWHGNCERTDPGNRVTLHATYGRITNRTMERYHHLPEEILARNGPELRSLIGRNDPFESKNKAIAVRGRQDAVEMGFRS